MVWLCSLLSTASLRNFSSKLRNASPAKKLRRSSGRQVRLIESWPRDDQHSCCSFAVIKISHGNGSWSSCQFCCNRDRRQGRGTGMIPAVTSD